MPISGSLAGGADLTIAGTGFGNMPANLEITVGDAAARCTVTSITPTALHCRVQSLTPTAPSPPPMDTAAQALVGQALSSFPSHRGARVQWLDDGVGGTSGEGLAADFSSPLDFEVRPTTSYTARGVPSPEYYPWRALPRPTSSTSTPPLMLTHSAPPASPLAHLSLE